MVWLTNAIGALTLNKLMSWHVALYEYCVQIYMHLEKRSPFSKTVVLELDKPCSTGVRSVKICATTTVLGIINERRSSERLSHVSKR